MRAFRRNQDREWEKPRYLAFEAILGNPNIKKSDKPRKPSDLFRLSTDIIIEITATKVTGKQAETIKKLGFTVPKAFIKDE